MTSKCNVAVVGSGAWGSALACVASRAGHAVTLWGRSETAIEEINSTQKNHKYLGDLALEVGIDATTDLADACRSAAIIVLATPTQSLPSVLAETGSISENVRLITVCKGIERTSQKLPTELVKEHFPDHAVACLSGPSFAVDVVANLPTAVTIACDEMSTAEALAVNFSTPTFRCYSSSDVRGAELGGALKNVLALAVGAARGMGLGASAEAALIARGFSEIRRIALALGAHRETLNGLSGLGDLVLTCSSTQSRNFTFGLAMGRGESLEGLPLAEGALTAGTALEIAMANKIETPIIEAVVKVLEKEVTARDAVQALLTRPLKQETSF